MRHTLLMAVGLFCLGACATESKNVAATGDSEPAQAQTAAVMPADNANQAKAQAGDVQPASTSEQATGTDTEKAPEHPDEASESGSTKKPPTTTQTAKPSAPVDVVCTPKGDSVHLAIKFLGDARDVNIDVWGTDGLKVRGDARPIRAQTYTRGAMVALDIPFVAPDNARSYLAIQVSGRFNDRKMGTVQACTIHPEFPDEDNKDADIRVDEHGQKIRVVHPD